MRTDMTELKNPTGPITPRRFSNGKFLMTVFADSQRFPDLHGFEMRDPYWIVAGWEGMEDVAGGGQRKTIVWSQPEILLYALPPCEDLRCGIGSSLLRAVEAAGKRPSLSLHVQRSNLRARAFYKSMGFDLSRACDKDMLLMSKDYLIPG